MNPEDLKRQIDKMMHEHNNQGLPDFEGYSPSEMYQIMNFPFSLNSPVQLQRLDDDDYTKIPILNQVKYLIGLIEKQGEIKLTTRGYLPVKIVSDLYKQGFLKDEYIESGISKLYKETDSMTIHLTKILMELAGLSKKRNGKLSLTNESKRLLANDDELFRLVFLTFGQKFNWAYFDGYGDNQIGQLGFVFSLILLAKYGQEKRLDSFYAGKYFKAFPKLSESIEHSYGTLESYLSSCYSLRTFDRFLNYFGLIKIETEGKRLDSIQYITKTDLFDRLILCAPHKKVDFV